MSIFSVSSGSEDNDSSLDPKNCAIVTVDNNDEMTPLNKKNNGKK